MTNAHTQAIRVLVVFAVLMSARYGRPELGILAVVMAVVAGIIVEVVTEYRSMKAGN